jgi:hypothetical protein
MLTVSKGCFIPYIQALICGIPRSQEYRHLVYFALRRWELKEKSGKVLKEDSTSFR